MGAGAMAGAEFGDKVMNSWEKATVDTINAKQQRDLIELAEAKRMDALRQQEVDNNFQRKGLMQSDRQQSMSGLNMLAGSRAQAQQQANLSGFRNLIYNTATPPG
jgi:hypothetical protein